MGIKLHGGCCNPSSVLPWKSRRCLVLIPLLYYLEVDWNPWSCRQSYIFPCEESTTSTREEWMLLWIWTGSIGRFMGKAVTMGMLTLPLLAHSCQQSGFQHTMWIWTHMCCLYCTHWQYFAQTRVKSYQETSLTWKRKKEVYAINFLKFLRTEFQVNV